MKAPGFLSGMFQRILMVTDFISEQFDRIIDDVILRMLVLLKPEFINNQAFGNIFNPRNPYWFMAAALNLMK